MKLAIDKNVPIPAYQQVVDGISGAVARGDLARGARIPSVRNLAVDLGLNVNTVARAYRDLERAGVVNTMPGMGTFVAPDAPGRPTHLVGRSAPAASEPHVRTIPATGGPLAGFSSDSPVSTSWRDLLAASQALAAAEGVPEAEFLEHAGHVASAAGQSALLLVVGHHAGEAADLIRALPTEVAARATACDLESLAERALDPSLAAVVTTFPGQSRARARLGEEAGRLQVIPVETELTEAAIRGLTSLPHGARIALVTVEKDRWDEEANDVMKIIGRHRWLKMVLLEGGGRGLAERLELLDAILYVPRAREAVEPFDAAGRVLVELARQATPRARERLLHAIGSSS